MKLSIIIPAYNEAKLIGNSIQKIRQAMDENPVPDFSYEIIVCNNNSTDNTEAICKELNVTTIFEKVNMIAKTRNTGASIANGDWWYSIRILWSIRGGGDIRQRLTIGGLKNPGMLSEQKHWEAWYTKDKE